MICKCLTSVLVLVVAMIGPAGVSATQPSQNAPQHASPLVFNTTRLANGKVVFALNHQPFFPVVYGFSLPTQSTVASLQAQLVALKAAGFTMLLTDIDYPWISSRWYDITQYFQEAEAEQLPVIVELQEWDYWSSWLPSHPKANMQLFTGQYITGAYPDYANAAAWQEHLRRFQAIVRALHSFLHRPIVAISLGAYDAYHIPDEESHGSDWSTPAHATFPQTWLPYNADVLPSYRHYLQAHGYTPAMLDVPTWQALKLPIQPNPTKPLVWESWMDYRAYAYVGAWLQQTALEVRRWSGLPVTVTLDIRPDGGWWEWGTPGLVEDRWFDFMIVYYYGLGSRPQASIEGRLALISHIYNDQGTPLIGLLEFSSSPTPGDLYVTDSFPWIAGVAQFGSDPRQQQFLRASHAAALHRTWMQWTPVPLARIVVSLDDPYDLFGVLDAESALEDGSVPFDVSDYWTGDTCPGLIIVPYGEPLLLHSGSFLRAAKRFREHGGTLLVAPNADTILHALQKVREKDLCRQGRQKARA